MKAPFFLQTERTSCSSRFPPVPTKQNTIPQDLILAHALMDANNNLTNNNNMAKSQRRELVSSHKDKTTIDYHTKRIMHRDVERQRRQEMTNLSTSLRNLLPLEYIKGKRAMSDHMQGAVNYIKDLEKKIEELGIKKDELKNQSNLRVLGSNLENSNNCAPTCEVMVRSCLVGVEVVISSGFEEQFLHQLSRMMQVLLKEGLNVISCVSTKVNQRLMHTILSEVGDLRCIDTMELKNKLMEAI